jgi:hypothetical protein
LRAALPKQHQQLKAECGADGKVFVVGLVNSVDEKLAVSHALRRLHGCTSVQNLTTLPIEVAQTTKAPIVKTSNPTEKPGPDGKAKSMWPFNKGGPTTTDEPPLLEVKKPEAKPAVTVSAKKPEPPVLLPELPELKPLPKVETPAPKTALTASELQKRIQAACPQVKSVEVQFTSAKDVTITLEIRTEAELSPTFERISVLRELQDYRPEIQFKITAP